MMGKFKNKQLVAEISSHLSVFPKHLQMNGPAVGTMEDAQK